MKTKGLKRRAPNEFFGPGEHVQVLLPTFKQLLLQRTKTECKKVHRQFKNVQMCREISKFSNPPGVLSRFAQRLRNVFWPSHGMAQRASGMQRAQDAQGRAPARRGQGSGVADGHHSSLRSASSSGLSRWKPRGPKVGGSKMI